MTDEQLIAAAVASLEAELGRALTEVELAQAERRAAGALIVIRARLGQDLSGLDQDALVWVLSEVLIARASNPEGFQSEGIDDYTYRYGSETRRVTILPEWWAALGVTSPGRVRSVRLVTPTSPA